MEAESRADAKTLGLEEELKNGVYTCCQIAAWAHEQWWAWFKAIDEDAKADSEEPVSSVDDDANLVPVRFRRPVPWFRTE